VSKDFSSLEEFNGATRYDSSKFRASHVKRVPEAAPHDMSPPARTESLDAPVRCGHNFAFPERRPKQKRNESNARYEPLVAHNFSVLRGETGNIFVSERAGHGR
jgi:hypothetical protein